ncbi:MAG: cytochrome c oxidase accessory protein CcoG [Bacteroidia bacterium]
MANTVSSSKVQEPFDPDAFRDFIGTVDSTGKRRWVFPKKPSGRYFNKRAVLSVVLLTLLFIGPFLRWNGDPFLLFNIIERKFIVFGITFWPQDFYLFVLAMISFFVFIVLFTVIFGRVWCGWACPQTIFMEMVFRRIEYWIEGDTFQQQKLAKAPWNADKIGKRTLKYSIFALFSFLIGNLMMAYMIGTEELSKIVTESPVAHWGNFTFVMVFSGIFFFVFAYFREQACIAVCPYGRLQGVLLGKDSMAVMYDWVRGEPRGKLKQQQAAAAKGESHGDCIDCKLCVAVCPTGIDIRHGTQLECINCTACIDACDSVMDKIERPRGLVRVASYNNIANNERFRITPRIIAYSVVLLGLLSVLGISLGSRNDVEATILRTSGMLFQRTEDGKISNLYNFHIVNKTIQELPVEIRLAQPAEGSIRAVTTNIVVKKQDIAKGVFFVDIPPEYLDGAKNKITVEVWSGGRVVDRVRTNFLGPIQ